MRRESVGGWVGLLLPAWFGVQLVGLEGGKAVDRAREVKEVGQTQLRGEGDTISLSLPLILK